MQNTIKSPVWLLVVCIQNDYDDLYSHKSIDDISDESTKQKAREDKAKGDKARGDKAIGEKARRDKAKRDKARKF